MKLSFLPHSQSMRSWVLRLLFSPVSTQTLHNSNVHSGLLPISSRWQPCSRIEMWLICVIFLHNIMHYSAYVHLNRWHWGLLEVCNLKIIKNFNLINGICIQLCRNPQRTSEELVKRWIVKKKTFDISGRKNGFFFKQTLLNRVP